MNKLLSMVIAAAMLAVMAGGAHEFGRKGEKIPPEAKAVYAPVLESWEGAIREGFGSIKGTGYAKRYPYIKMTLPSELCGAHYAYFDVDGNGVYELLIAAFFRSGDGGWEYLYMADIFTIHGDEPVRLFEGVEDRGFWTRNRLDFSADGQSLVIAGSGGAAYSTYDFYRVADNGYQVVLTEGLTTYNVNDPSDSTPYYHRADGTYVPAGSIDGVMDKYFEKTYFEGSAEAAYISRFNKRIAWTPVAQNEDKSIFVYSPEE